MFRYATFLFIKLYGLILFGGNDLLVTLFIVFFSKFNLALLIMDLEGIAEGLIDVVMERISCFFGKVSYTTLIAEKFTFGALLVLILS